MKKLIAVLMIFFAAAVWVSALATYTTEQLAEIGLTQEQIQQILKIQNTYSKKIREAALEMNIYKAQLEKMLFEANPDMEKVKKLLEESLQYRLQSEMAAIQERTQTRQLVGEENFQKLMRLRKRLREEQLNQTRTQTQTQTQTQTHTQTQDKTSSGSSHGK